MSNVAAGKCHCRGRSTFKVNLPIELPIDHTSWHVRGLIVPNRSKVRLVVGNAWNRCKSCTSSKFLILYFAQVVGMSTMRIEECR